MATTQAKRPNRPRYVVPAPMRNFEFVGTLPDEIEELQEVSCTVLPTPWIVVLVNQEGKPQSVGYLAESEAEADAWCDAYEQAWHDNENNEAVDELKPHALPLPPETAEHWRFDMERRIAERLQFMADQLISTMVDLPEGVLRKAGSR